MMRVLFALGVSAAAVSARVMQGMETIVEGGYDVTHEDMLSATLPDEFDTRTAFPGCAGRVWDQGHCGSCWAFAAVETLSDRFCIASNGETNVTLSAGDLLACEHLNLGCTMGSLPNWAWHYLKHKGVRTNSCVPYASGHGDTQRCVKDKPSYPCRADKYYVSDYQHCGSTFGAKNHVRAIQECLLQGPVDATFNVYANFQRYAGQGDVYQKKAGGHTGGFEGLHSVKVVGWGNQPTTDPATNVTTFTPYWTVQNSWGAHWGREHGFFKILRGSNDCGFEELMYTGTPKLD